MTYLAQVIVVLRAMWQRADESELGLISAGVAFFGFLSIFPAVAAMIAIVGFAADPMILYDLTEVLEDFLPSDAFDLVNGQVQALITANTSTLGWATGLSMAVALWSARSGVAALIGGLNAVHDSPRRTGMRHLLRAMALTLTLLALALASVVASVISPVMLALLPLGETSAASLEWANLALGILVVVLGIGLAYRYGPNHIDHRPPFFTAGLLVAVLLWALASRGFVFYLTNFGAYNQVYGSIGAVVGLLMWLYLSAYAVLLGAALDAVRRNDPASQGAGIQ